MYNPHNTDLDVPVPVPHVVEPELVSDLGGVHGLGQVLLVGKHQHHGLPQLVLRQHPVELVSGPRYPLSVIAVHNKNKTICVLKDRGINIIMNTF